MSLTDTTDCPLQREVDVFELDAEEQVAAEAPDGQPAVHVVVGLPDDEAAEPVLEPGGLRHDQRERRRADDQRAQDRDDLKERASRRTDLANGRHWSPSTSERLSDAEVHAPVPRSPARR